ncbi:hypothetical protein A6A04_16200 [Paramagnetospirillum marisnigri]|uniref:HTH luxR-type domain-containing protein n=1 Tax=Paramagnetospirillum marisnigri TaxID=1285242 RepID=A0A178MQR5_9PROT|nr:hypothetical protein A6A04_16200 [Paramagnetospirillum marisnigri]
MAEAMMPGAEGYPSAPFTVISQSGRIPERVILLRLADMAPFTLALLFQDDGSPPFEEAALCRLYDLTPAEGKLTAYLARTGGSIRVFAELSNISVNTVRTHLKRIFLKMGVSSQADLVRKVYAESARLPRGGDAPQPVAPRSLVCARLPSKTENP